MPTQHIHTSYMVIHENSAFQCIIRYSASCVLDEKMDTLIIVGGMDLHYDTKLPDILVVNLKTRTLLSCFQMQKEVCQYSRSQY